MLIHVPWFLLVLHVLTVTVAVAARFVLLLAAARVLRVNGNAVGEQELGYDQLVLGMNFLRLKTKIKTTYTIRTGQPPKILSDGC